MREIANDGTRSLAWLDDRRVAAGDYHGTLRVIDVETGKSLREMKHGDQVVALATDGKVAWTGGWDKVRSIKRWDVETGKSLGETKLEKPCASMARSPDGKLVACVTYGGALHVFDWASGELANIAKAHDDRVDGVAWTNDGAHIVTVSEFDETLRLFDAKGKALAKAISRGPRASAWGLTGASTSRSRTSASTASASRTTRSPRFEVEFRRAIRARGRVGLVWMYAGLRQVPRRIRVRRWRRGRRERRRELHRGDVVHRERELVRAVVHDGLQHVHRRLQHAAVQEQLQEPTVDVQHRVRQRLHLVRGRGDVRADAMSGRAALIDLR